MRSTPLDRPTAPPRRPSAPADYDEHTVGRVGRMAVTGALCGAVVLGIVVVIGTLAATTDLSQALGVGVAVALTGGPFFGGLVGFAMAVHAAESAAGLSVERAAVERLTSTAR